MRLTRGSTVKTGLHVVKRDTKDGLRWHVYAYRGGPRIHTSLGQRPVITPAMLDAAFRAKRHSGPEGTISWLASEYRNSGEFTEDLSIETKRDYRKSLDRIEEEYGTASLSAFEDRRMRGEIIKWRDKWRSQPRTADKLTVMLGTLLNWGLERAYVAINVASGISQIHKADRSDLIWEDRHWAAWRVMDGDKPRCPAHLMDALVLTSMTGLRLSDLVQLDWTHVGANAIILVTKKRKGRAVIPILPELRKWLDARDQATPTVLVNSRGKPWTPSGLGGVFQTWKPEGFDRTMHDLRGTFVTFLAVKGLTDEQIARIVGWTAKRVAEVRARYVDEARVVVELAKKLSA